MILAAACGGGSSTPAPEATAVDTPSSVEVPTPLAVTPGIDFSTGYFPITLVPDPDLAWVSVSSMTRQQSAEGDGTIDIVVEGSVRMVKDGLVDYRFSLTDETGALHEDSGGVLLGHHEEGEEIPYQTIIGVPKGATFFSSFNIRFEGEEKPKLRLHVELPLSRIPLRAP